MATKKRQAKKAARKAVRKSAAEDGVAAAQEAFMRFLRKADPKKK